jgi:hypothetical protein
MKKFWLTSTLLCLAVFAWAQLDNSLYDFNENRLRKQKTAMTVLGTWAVGNIAVGASLMGKREGTDKYFHQMNLGWGAINLALAGFGYYSAVNTDPGSFGLNETMNEQHRFQKILLFNADLDVGYMLGGAYLIERSKNTPDSKNPERLKGFGQSIILQGAFLFVFDLATYLVLAKDNENLQPLLGNLTFTGDSIGLIWQF